MATLREMRTTRGLKLKDVAAGTGIFYGRLSQIERGVFPATFSEMDKLSEFYGVHPDGWRFIPEHDER